MTRPPSARHRRRPAVTVAVVACACLLVASCGSSGKSLAALEDPGGPPTTTTAAATATTVTPASTTAGPPATNVKWVSAAANLVGMQSECGNLSLVSNRPDRDMLIASIAQHGLWASLDGGASWTPLGQGPGSGTITNRGSSIVYDPAHADTFWESGIYNGAGVYRTDDNGVTFHQLGDAHHIDAVGIDLTDPARRTLLVGAHQSATLLRSSDGGATWTDISASLPSGVGFASGPFVVAAKEFLLGTNHGTASAIYRSTDGGATWKAVYNGGVVGQVAIGGGKMYWMLENGGLVKSSDGGATWTAAARAGTLSVDAPVLQVLPDGTLAAVGGQGIVTSSDQGATWHKIGPPIPFLANGFTYSPFRKAFYAWHFTCNRDNGENPVPADSMNPVMADSIMRLDVTGLT
jgi:photosystem II stability/assembly factor-like uncharacterized protein